MEQRSPEWYASRAGKATASRIADVIAKTKSGYSTSRANYAAQLVCERLTGVVEESYNNAAMQWGAEKEPEARRLYEFMRDVTADEVALVDHPHIAMSAASPDGLINDDGLIEIKCPNTATHIEYLLSKEVPSKYKPQMAWQMACTGRQWCDFVSYDPRLPANLQLFVVRYERDERYIAELEAEVKAFLAEVSETVKRLEELK